MLSLGFLVRVGYDMIHSGHIPHRIRGGDMGDSDNWLSKLRRGTEGKNGGQSRTI